ncbi:hypothetical protein [Streptomyces sp. UG1]|uniref:hypothetical protein n=1 Tax=Streptomyces sp. UG1 TaxID=3417652 RepID=UPI003CF7A70E
MGIREGDFDGDDKKDRAALLLKGSGDGTGELSINVSFGNGGSRSQIIVDKKEYSAHQLTEPKWLNWREPVDLNEDDQDDLFVVGLAGGRSILVWHFEYQSGELKPLRGLGDASWFNHGTWGNSTGITCRERNGRPEIVFVTLSRDWDSRSKEDLFRGATTFYRADDRGAFAEVSQDELTYPAADFKDGWPSELAQYEGLNCPGLVYPGW